jgi:hypothetical protein
VAEPAPDDALSLNDYYDPRVLAPLHLINVTMNQTVDPAEQLVQRDRKGKPLCIGPGPALVQPGSAAAAGRRLRALHGRRATLLREIAAACRRRTRSIEMAQARTVGDWIAISGAAISTGLGRATTLGTSLLLGLANLRLGIWWPSHMADGPAARPRTAADIEHDAPGAGAAVPYAVVSACELTARFHGTRRRWQYLSDGGHFENTAVYELLRPERRRAVVMCDCGCDPNYRLATCQPDPAGAHRLWAGDRCRSVAPQRPVLGPVFGTPDDFAPMPHPSPATSGAVAQRPYRRQARPTARR